MNIAKYIYLYKTREKAIRAQLEPDLTQPPFRCTSVLELSTSIDPLNRPSILPPFYLPTLLEGDQKPGSQPPYFPPPPPSPSSPLKTKFTGRAGSSSLPDPILVSDSGDFDRITLRPIWNTIGCGACRGTGVEDVSRFFRITPLVSVSRVAVLCVCGILASGIGSVTAVELVLIAAEMVRGRW